MFPYHNKNDPFFVQFSRDSDPLQHTYPYNLDFAGDNAPVDFAAGFPLPHDEISTGSSLYRAAEINEDDLDGDRKKKHREIGRFRRKEMAALYSNFRPVVPPRVGPWSDGVEIIISIHVALEECVHLSAIIEALVHEGLNVVSWVSNQEGHRMIYTIHCEVSATGGLDLTQLKLWLTNLVPCGIARQDM